MRTSKKFLLTLLAILTFCAIGGYLYFDKKFTPPDNYLRVSQDSGNIPINWVRADGNAYSALLLPVNLKGTDKIFHMQLDFGSPITIFYRTALRTIGTELTGQNLIDENTERIDLGFQLKNMFVSSDNFKVIDYGDKVDLDNPKTDNIIGTLGTDLLEKRVLELDFKNNLCSFSEKRQTSGFNEFEFKKRKILLPARIGNESLRFMYDSGTSGYELITSRGDWEKYRDVDGKITTAEGNSWGQALKIVSATADQIIRFGDAEFPLTKVTYIEGTSKIQNILMALSGMQGMIGNKLFLGHKIILDCGNEKFKVE